jgi:16S rRNA (guanine527-N7)-methyltransferase
VQELIEKGAAAMEIVLPEGAAERMAAFWANVLDVNRTMNLTRVVDDEAACALHFLDSFAPLLYGEDLLPQGANVVDLGTGAGFPGVPLAIARPDLRVTLLDARRKRILFLREAIERLGLPNVRAEHGRAEETRMRADVVCARAVAALPKLLAWSIPLLGAKGRMIFWKGPAVLDEYAEASSFCEKNNLQIYEPVFYEIPGMDARHCLVVAEKRG